MSLDFIFLSIALKESGPLFNNSFTLNDIISAKYPFDNNPTRLSNPIALAEFIVIKSSNLWF